jgi:hypothetical protein
MNKNVYFSILSFLVLVILSYDFMVVNDTLLLGIFLTVIITLVGLSQKNIARKICFWLLMLGLLSAVIMAWAKSGAFTTEENQKSFFAVVFHYVMPILFFSNPKVIKLFK